MSRLIPSARYSNECLTEYRPWATDLQQWQRLWYQLFALALNPDGIPQEEVARLMDSVYWTLGVRFGCWC